MADLDALAESLAATAASLDAHIERRALEIAQEQIAIVAENAERRIAELRADLAASEQRRTDVIAEFEKRIARRDRQIERRDARIVELEADAGRYHAAVGRLFEAPRHVRDGLNMMLTKDVVAAMTGEGEPE